MKICLVSSSGGHLIKTYYLKNWWKNFDRVWVTRNDLFSNNLLKDERKLYAYFPDKRSIVNFIRNFILAYKILKEEKPDLIFSLGAGVCVPFFILGKLFNIKSVFVETFIFIPQKTLTGKLVENFASLIIVQNKQLLPKYKNAKYWGSLL